MCVQSLNSRLHINRGKEKRSFLLTPTSCSSSNFFNAVPFKAKKQTSRKNADLAKGLEILPKIPKHSFKLCGSSVFVRALCLSNLSGAKVKYFQDTSLILSYVEYVWADLCPGCIGSAVLVSNRANSTYRLSICMFFSLVKGMEQLPHLLIVEH